MFQSTHPHRVRRTGRQPISGRELCFNPRTHIGCDLDYDVSSRRWSRFNPRTHIGCDTWRSGCARSTTCFNPRTHIGCDLKELQDLAAMIGFNPRTHIGCDYYIRQANVRNRLFQSTHPHRLRLPQCRRRLTWCVFQSTHPHRVRLGTQKNT